MLAYEHIKKKDGKLARVAGANLANSWNIVGAAASGRVPYGSMRICRCSAVVRYWTVVQ